MKKVVILLLLGGVIVFLSYLTGYYFGLESRTVRLVSNVFHFLGGIYAFFFVISVFDVTKKYHNTAAAPFMKALFFIFGALALGVLWEWYEFIFIYYDKVFSSDGQGAAVYADTMGDLALDLLGAASAGFYFLVKRK